MISAIGAMFAPNHQATADELVRVCQPGGTIGLLSWTPEGMIGGLFRTIGPFAPAPPPGAQPPPLWGGEEHLAELLRRPGRVDDAGARRARGHRLPAARATSPSTSAPATARPSRPRTTPRKDGREDEFRDALHGFFEQANLGSAEDARFEMEYLVAVGRKQRMSGGGGKRYDAVVVGARCAGSPLAARLAGAGPVGAARRPRAAARRHALDPRRLPQHAWRGCDELGALRAARGRAPAQPDASTRRRSSATRSTGP